MKDTFSLVNEFLGKIPEAPAKAAGIRIERLQASGQAEVHKAIAGFGDSDGWLCLTHRVVAWRKGIGVAGLSADDIVLSGELASDSRSLHIRPAQGGWDLHEFTHLGEGDDLVLEETLLVTGGKERVADSLAYEVFWRKRDVGGRMVYQPYVSRFAGFRDGR